MAGGAGPAETAPASLDHELNFVGRMLKMAGETDEALYLIPGQAHMAPVLAHRMACCMPTPLLLGQGSGSA